MAGEILTGGLSEPEIIKVATFSGLDYINISHVVGMLYFQLNLQFVVGRSNKMLYRVYFKGLGSSTWSMYASGELDSTFGAADTITLESLQNGAWLIAIMPLQVIVRNVDCGLTLKAMSRMNLSESYAGSNKNKLLRVCNNMKAEPTAATEPFDSWDYITKLSSSINHKLTTSVGTPMKNGQYIFGQN